MRSERTNEVGRNTGRDVHLSLVVEHIRGGTVALFGA